MNMIHRSVRLAAAAAALSACLSFPSFGSEASPDTAGPGIEIEAEQEEAEAPAAEEEDGKGDLLGIFTTTGYCNCSKCSGGHQLTYSGTVPTADHTISADLTQFPIGTKLWIDGTIYTVEDKGSSVKGHWIDIFYASHEEALAHGMQSQEVYSVAD